MDRSPGFGSAACNFNALFELGFPSAPRLTRLTLLQTTTRRLILQQARRRTPYSASTACKHTISCSISLPFRGSFHLSLTVLVLYRSLIVFSLTKWSSLIRPKFHVFRATRDHLKRRFAFKYGTITLYGPTFQLCSSSLSLSYSLRHLQLPTKCPTTPLSQRLYPIT